MSAPALSIAFFDPRHGLHCSARSGATLLFEGSHSNVLPHGPRIEPDGGGWSAELEGSFAVTLRPIADAAALGDGFFAHVCGVEGTVGGQAISCLGTVGETERTPRWEDLDALRSVSAIFDCDHAALAVSRRPRGVPGHGHEQVVGWVLDEGRPLPVEKTRISTVYDGDGRQRGAGLELWIPDEDLPRRVSGTVVAGSSLSMEGLDVHAAVFRWRMENRGGSGAYELWRRASDLAAA